MNRSRNQPSAKPRAFTLVELMVTLPIVAAIMTCAMLLLLKHTTLPASASPSAAVGAASAAPASAGAAASAGWARGA